VITSALYGASALGCWATGVIFLRAWRRSFDRLLLAFSIAFGILGLQYFIIAVAAIGSELRPYVFAIRLVAFALILIGIADKNRGR
jgi:hypothetical protein